MASFEVPIFGLTSDTRISKIINLDLNKLIPSDIRAASLPVHGVTIPLRPYQFATATVQLASSTSRAPILWRTSQPNVITFHDLCNGQGLKICLGGLTPSEYIAPSVEIVNNNDDEFCLFFGITSGVLFRVKMPPLSQTSNPLGSIRQELFKYKSSIFVLNSQSSVQDRSPAGDPLHGICSLAAISESAVITRNEHRISLWELTPQRAAIRRASAKVTTTKAGVDEGAAERTHIAQTTINFMGSFFRGSAAQRDEFMGTTILSWAYFEDYIYIVQSDGLFRRLHITNNHEIVDDAKFHLVRELAVKHHLPTQDSLSGARLYIAAGILIAYFFDDRKVLRVTKVEIRDPINGVNKRYFNIDLSVEVRYSADCKGDRLEFDERLADVVDFQYNESSQNLWILQKDSQQQRIIVSDENFEGWKQIQLSAITEEDDMLSHISHPHIHNNFLESDSIGYVLSECYQIDTPLTTRESLVKEILQRFCCSVQTAMCEMTAQDQTINNTFLTTLNFPESVSRIDVTRIKEDEQESLAEFYQALIDHEHSQNTPVSMDGNMVLHRNRVGYVFQKTATTSGNMVLHNLFLKWSRGTLGVSDFLESVELHGVNPFKWSDQGPAVDTVLGGTSTHLTPRLQACIKLLQLECLCCERLYTMLRLRARSEYDVGAVTSEADMHYLSALYAAYSVFKRIETKTTLADPIGAATDQDPDELDLSQLVIDQEVANYSLSPHSERCLLEIYIEQCKPRGLPFSLIDFNENNSLKFLHFLIDVGKKGLARQLLQELAPLSGCDNLTSGADSHVATLASIIIIPEEDSCEDIVDAIRDVYKNMDSSNLFLFDESRTIDMAIVYRDDVIQFLTEVGLSGEVNRAIKLIYLLQVISILENLESEECAAALVQVAQIALTESGDPGYSEARDTLSTFQASTIQLSEYRQFDNDGNACLPPILNTVYNELASVLNSKMFMHYLKSGDYDAAYEIAFQNPSKDQRLACLRHLICYLCERNQCDKLTTFDYTGCLQDVQDILLSRARASQLFVSSSTELTAMKYYEVLISLLVKRSENYLAAQVAVEVARRLRNEPAPKWMQFDEYLTHLEDALLPASMLLSISEKSWLVYRKVISQQGHNNFGLNQAHLQPAPNEIVTIEMLRRELLRVQKIQMVQHNNPEAAAGLLDADALYNADPIVRTLCQEEFFDDAVDLVTCERGDFSEVVRNISGRVAHNFTKTKDLRASISKLSAQNNGIINLLKVGDDDKWGRYLRAVVQRVGRIVAEERLEPGKARGLYETCIKQFILNGVGAIPSWLIEGYGLTASIRLFARNGRLDEAAIFTLEVIKSNQDLLQSESYDQIISDQRLATIPWKVVEEIIENVQKLPLEPSLIEELEQRVEEYMELLEQLDKMMVERKNMQTNMRPAMFAAL